MTELHTVFLGTGSNLGDRVHNLARARREIAARIGAIVAASAIYRTAAWGFQDQPDFLNQALRCETELSPGEALDRILSIEMDMGRIRDVKWGARLIDIDILFFDDLIIRTDRLVIPHPQIAARRFVLAPMLEIAPDWKHPVNGKTIAEMEAGTEDSLPVEIYIPGPF